VTALPQPVEAMPVAARGKAPDVDATAPGGAAPQGNRLKGVMRPV